MARFGVGRGYFANFNTVPVATADGEITATTAHLIRIAVDRVADGVEAYIGDFRYVGGLPEGTVRTYRFTSGDDLIYRIADAEIDVLELRRIAGDDDPQKFLQYIFRADDQLDGAALGDEIAGFGGDDRLRGHRGDDVLRGRADADALFGGLGRDALYGGRGDDRLDGGAQGDFLHGGAGRDVFVFRRAGAPDRIADFGDGDRIALGFAGLGPGGPLDADAFHVGTRAETADQRVIYDIEAGLLLYAAEGDATGDPVRFARIDAGIEDLSAADFLVI